MKKYFSIALASLALVALSAACSKEKTVDDGTPVEPVAKTMTIKATISDAATRVTFDPSFDSSFKPTAMSHTWEDGDKLLITDATDFTVSAEFDLVDGAGTPNGVFEGEGFEAPAYNVEVVPKGRHNMTDVQLQAKDGATDHLKFVAEARGVTDLSSIQLTETSAIIGIVAKLPRYAAETVDQLVIETSTDDFVTSSTLTVSFEQIGDEGYDNILKIYANVPYDWSLSAGTQMLLHFYTSNYDHLVYTRYLELPASAAIKEGKFNYIKVNCVNTDAFAGGEGTESDPYLIVDKYQLLAMRDQMGNKLKIYFKLLADIDLTDEIWVPLNNESGFAKGIDFDGNGHTISNLTADPEQDYPSFAGVLNGTIKNLTIDGATIEAGGKTAGVLAGYIGSTNASVKGSIRGITVKNATVSGSKQRLGGLAGYANVVEGDLADCHVLNTTVSSTADRVGGLFGQVDEKILTKDCTAENVTVSGTINIGGLVGVGYGNFTDCTSSGKITSINTTNNADIGLGGLVGYFEKGTISHCSSSVNAIQTTNGRDIGGLIGKMLIGKVEKSYSTGNVSGIQRNVGGLIGLITNNGSGDSVVSDCYATGSVNANAYSGGLLGLFEKGNAVISNCYSTSKVEGAGFAMGGLVGVAAAATFQMKNSAAWCGSVIAANIGSANWSSGAVVAVAFPTCTLTGNYRNPSMNLTAYWGTETGYTVQLTPDFDHADVSSTTPLTDSTGAQMTDVSTASGQPHYPIYPYQGHVDAGKTLSQLASTTLGWSSDVWDFSGALPTLK